MFRNLIILLSFLCVLSISANLSAQNKRELWNFNYGWQLAKGDIPGAQAMNFDDSDWQKVSLPRAWNEDEAFRVDIHDLSTGLVWYRKHFKLPGELAGNKLFLEFEGIRQGGEIYLNGTYIGRHENGAMAFGLDISQLARFGDESNVIALRIDNSWDYREINTKTKYQWSDKNFNANYGGIPKNVWLHSCGKLYQTLPLYSNLGTTGIYIYGSNYDIAGHKADITAESQVRNEGQQAITFNFEVALEDIDGNILKQFRGLPVTVSPGQMLIAKASSPVEGLHFWSWGYGYLYKVHTRLLVDGKTADEVVTQTGFRKTNFGQGMIWLNDRVIQVKGYAQRTSNEWPAVGMSVPAWLSDFSNNLMVESNANLVRWMHITPWKQDVESCDRVGLIQAMPAGDSEKDVNDCRWQQRVELMRDAIIYNRNNPSIVFYEGGNENISEEHMAELKAIRDIYDPYGGRAIGSREMLASQVAEYGGEMLYINKSSRIPFWAMEYSRDEGLRRYADEYTWPFHKDGPAYNRNQDSHAIENIVRWYDYWQARPGTGTRVSSGGVNIVFSDTNTHFRGDENYRRSGEVDAMRIAKDGFFAHQVMWDGWVDIERPRAYIMGHWNYQPGTVKDIFVCASCTKVELLVNGESMGFGKRSKDFLFTFENIAWQPGTIEAVGYDDAGKELCRVKRETAGTPSAIRLTGYNGPDGFMADGADLMLVEVEVVDDQGRRCPTSFNMIDFELTGPAQWRGGIAQGPDNYILAKSLPVELGINRVLLRSEPVAGKITLIAKSSTLKQAELNINSLSIEQNNGLSSYIPRNQLTGNLSRGETPQTPSYTVKRIPLDIIGGTASDNIEDMPLSYDDNEETNWSATAGKIRYDLAKEGTISQIVLKLGNWRNRSYPLAISVDDNEVWQGNTPMSLGYVTIDIAPTRGSSLTIALSGNETDEDKFNLVEVTGQKDSQGQINKATKGKLTIIEVEIYQTAE